MIGKVPVGSGLTTKETLNPRKSATMVDITASTVDFTSAHFVLGSIRAVSFDSL